MDPRLWSFTQGIRLLIGILVLVVVSGFAVFGAWTALNILRFRRQQRQADEQFRAGRIDDEGNPLPPRAQGVCDRCGRVFNSVSYFPGNVRVCDACRVASSPSGPVARLAEYPVDIIDHESHS